MRSIFNFVIKPKESRNVNIKKVNGSDLILNTDVQDHKYVNRIGIIIGLPKAGCLGINLGEEVVVHHNVFRRFYDIRGVEKNSSSYFMDDVFIVVPDQIFMHREPGGDWNPINGYCFVKPVVSSDIWSSEKEKELIGVLKHVDDTLLQSGFNKGDLVGFLPRSEYEFIIDGERTYRVESNSIAINYGYSGNEKEYNPSWA